MDFARIGEGVATGGWSEIGRAAGLFGGGGGPNFGRLQSLLDQRNAEIDAFSQRLEAARNNVLGNYQNLQASTLNRFMPQFEASLAGRGLTAGSGAFASGVGLAAGNLQGQYDAMNAQMTENNLNTVEQMKSQLFGQQFGLANAQAMIPWQQRQAQQQAFGKLLGTGVGAFFGGMGGAAVGNQVGGMVGGQGGGMMDLNLSASPMTGFGGNNQGPQFYNGSMRPSWSI